MRYQVEEFLNNDEDKIFLVIENAKKQLKYAVYQDELYNDLGYFDIYKLEFKIDQYSKG